MIKFRVGRIPVILLRCVEIWSWTTGSAAGIAYTFDDALLDAGTKAIEIGVLG